MPGKWKTWISAVAAAALTGCVSYQFPAETAAIGMTERVEQCFLATPMSKIWELSDAVNVPVSRFEGGCEVWFRFNKFKRDLGRAEENAVLSGRGETIEYDYMLDQLSRVVTVTPSEIVAGTGGNYRMVRTLATMTGENGTVTAEALSVWRKSANGWQLRPLSEFPVDGNRVVDSALVPVVCRMTASDTEEKRVCRDADGNWSVAN
jgi:hypothetical protein